MLRRAWSTGAPSEKPVLGSHEWLTRSSSNEPSEQSQRSTSTCSASKSSVNSAVRSSRPPRARTRRPRAIGSRANTPRPFDPAGRTSSLGLALTSTLHLGGRRANRGQHIPAILCFVVLCALFVVKRDLFGARCKKRDRTFPTPRFFGFRRGRRGPVPFFATGSHAASRRPRGGGAGCRGRSRRYCRRRKSCTISPAGRHNSSRSAHQRSRSPRFMWPTQYMSLTASVCRRAACVCRLLVEPLWTR